jgi:hypothetical protein
MESTARELLVIVWILSAMRLESCLVSFEDQGQIAVWLQIFIDIEADSLKDVEVDHQHVTERKASLVVGKHKETRVSIEG